MRTRPRFLGEKHTTVVYHGSRVPYLKKFDWRKQGTGVVTSNRLGGFFFTSSCENAHYFADFTDEHPTEAWIVRAKLRFRNLYIAKELSHPPSTIREIGKLYHPFDPSRYDGVLCRGVRDGSHISDVYFVWSPRVIQILGYGQIP